MIKGYIKKENLYKLIDEKLSELGITHKDYPLDARAIAQSIGPSLKIEYHKFPTNKMGGILYKGEEISSMALNTLRSEKGQNFDCMHELIHYWFHPPGTMLCVDSNYIHQNSGREWQANEGAAQALMPKDLFICKYIELDGNISALSDFFMVGERCVEFRINNLKLSESHLNKVKNDDAWSFFDNLWSKEIESSENTQLLIPNNQVKYCPHCNNTEVSNNSYCKVCGNWVRNLITGVDGMQYREGVALDGNAKAVICPKCANENIQPGDMFCKICGLYLYQQCTNVECDCTPDSNARYCPTCGSKTTFYIYGVLSDWQIESDMYILF